MEAISINIETTDDALKIWLMVKLDVKALVKKHLVLILSTISASCIHCHDYQFSIMNRKLLVNHAVHILILNICFLNISHFNINFNS